MKVQCALCGAELERANPTKHCFCCAEHRNEWMRQNVDFAALSRGHKAKHLTKLNAERNPHCRVSERGKVNSKKARQEAEAYLGRPLQPGEVVHHMNGHADDNRHENLLIMPDKQHRQLHMALAIEKHKDGDHDADNKDLIEQYALYMQRTIQCQEGINQYGLLAKHPTTQMPIASPYFNMALQSSKQANLYWMQIYQIVKDNCETPIGNSNPNDDLMERLLG